LFLLNITFQYCIVLTRTCQAVLEHKIKFSVEE